MQAPNIVEIIGERIDLRRSGKEFVGLCPFHDDRHPSLNVNEEKQVFLCRACQAKGDVFNFLMLADGLTFTEAKHALGIESGRKPRPVLTPSRKRAAEVAATWTNEQRARLNVLLAASLEQRDLADEIGDFELAEVFERELVMLRGFYDALGYARGVAEMLALRHAIEAITDGAGVTL